MFASGKSTLEIVAVHKDADNSISIEEDFLALYEFSYKGSERVFLA
jgi:hypothetical protein